MAYSLWLMVLSKEISLTADGLNEMRGKVVLG